MVRTASMSVVYMVAALALALCLCTVKVASTKLDIPTVAIIIAIVTASDSAAYAYDVAIVTDSVSADASIFGWTLTRVRTAGHGLAGRCARGNEPRIVTRAARTNALVREPTLHPGDLA